MFSFFCLADRRHQFWWSKDSAALCAITNVGRPGLNWMAQLHSNAAKSSLIDWKISDSFLSLPLHEFLPILKEGNGLHRGCKIDAGFLD